jgi:hypothetical protein
MDTKLSLQYDREGDVLHISKCTPYAEQESEELDDGIVARLNPATREIESLEILFFSSRFSRNQVFELPVAAQLRVAARS